MATENVFTNKKELDAIRNKEVPLFDAFEQPQGDVTEWSAADVEDYGKRMVAAYLIRGGYELEEMDYKCAWHEANFGGFDILAREKRDEVVLLDVRTWVNPEHGAGLPELSITSDDVERKKKAALMYLATHFGVDKVRYDVIALVIIGNRQVRLRHVCSCFAIDESH